MQNDNVASGNSLKGKEILSEKKGKAVLELSSAPKRHKNYVHFHEDVGLTHFCKVILGPKLEFLLMPPHFTKATDHHPSRIVLRPNIGCVRRAQSSR